MHMRHNTTFRPVIPLEVSPSGDFATTKLPQGSALRGPTPIPCWSSKGLEERSQAHARRPGL